MVTSLPSEQSALVMPQKVLSDMADKMTCVEAALAHQKLKWYDMT